MISKISWHILDDVKSHKEQSITPALLLLKPAALEGRNAPKSTLPLLRRLKLLPLKSSAPLSPSHLLFIATSESHNAPESEMPSLWRQGLLPHHSLSYCM